MVPNIFSQKQMSKHNPEEIKPGDLVWFIDLKYVDGPSLSQRMCAPHYDLHPLLVLSLTDSEQFIEYISSMELHKLQRPTLWFTKIPPDKWDLKKPFPGF